MIAALTGTVQFKDLSSVVINCAGVGYRAFCAPNTLAQLTTGEEVTLLTTLVVREDALTLYGFNEPAEQELFTLVQTVSGIGPKGALATLSVFTAAQFATAVASGDVKSLQRIPGVGKKVAERLALELKDKVKALSLPEEAGATLDQLAAGEAVAASGIQAEVVQALIGLGFSEAQGSAAVAAVLQQNPDAAKTSSSLLRLALATVAKK